MTRVNITLDDLWLHHLHLVGIRESLKGSLHAQDIFELTLDTLHNSIRGWLLLANIHLGHFDIRLFNIGRLVLHHLLDD